jgi:flagellar hook assembly protein FlgD
VTTVAKAVFAALVVATVGAFFAAQQLKSSPPLVQQVGVEPWLSPNQDGRFERAKVSFRLKRGDTVDVQIVDREGDEVDELASGRDLRAGEQFQERWDGRDDQGVVLPDGTYRARVVLRNQGRTVTLQQNIRLDTEPPAPRVLSIGPQTSKVPRPEILPNAEGEPARIRFAAPGRLPSVEIWRTDLDRPRRVMGLRIETERKDDRLPQGIGTTTWDGTREDGTRAPQGTYVAVVRVRDQAGNIGQSIPDSILQGRTPIGRKVRGKGGITVRYLGAQPPMVPVGAGRELTLGIDARGETYNWELRKVGEGTRRAGSRRSTAVLTRPAPRGKSGLYLFEARTRDRQVQVPVAVDDKRNNRVLVVLPATTWQGLNRADDDGDGLPNTLAGRSPVRINRVFTELPEQIASGEGPLLAHLHREGVNFDLTTDAALATGVGPKLDGHRGVLIAGDATWLTSDVRRSLRSFVAGGGTLASLGTRSLRGEVRQSQRRFLTPRGPSDTDIFGARILPIQQRTVNLVSLEDDPKLQLFAGEEGLFPNVEAWEATRSVGSEAKLASSAVTEEDSRAVIVAARFGDGLVIRTGIPGFATRLSGDETSAELLRRIWTLLRTG